ncbi:MAG: zinc ABC transporter substrate-binding protein, partial [Actinomycetes bacterium]
MKRLFAVLTAATLLLTLSACGLLPTEPRKWSRGTGEISIVATTNVWADLAYQIGGKAVTSHAIIFNVSQDPHSYEATVRDQLMVEKADLILMNGGGYDDFMHQLAKENNYNAAPVINAVNIAGTREDGNEHIWFSIDRVRIVAAEIAAKLKRIALP